MKGLQENGKDSRHQREFIIDIGQNLRIDTVGYLQSRKSLLDIAQNTMEALND